MAGNGPLTGKTFSNRYQLGERIGVGGMAEVYSAQDMVLGRIVAVKTMLPQYAADPDFTRRFRQEAAAAANLQSPYIVNVYDWGHDEDTYYIVMEFVRGSDLKTAIQERGAINQRKVAEIGSQVCQALSVAHQQDIIHRDVKPQNIMVQPDGNVKVMDFGIARAKNSTAQKTETVLGTAHYTSPEQAQGKDLTAASDIYSLGVVLYEAATGTLPFDGPDAVSVALMQVRDIPPAPREVNPDIDPAFEAIILTAMQKDPNARFATANDMRLALNDYLAGRPINFAALVAGGAAAAAVGAAAAHAQNGSDFTSARTSVISPIGAAAGDVDSTQVMPVAGVGKTQAYGGANGQNGRRYNNGGRGQAPEDEGKKKGPIIAAVVVALIAVIGILAFVFLSGDKVDVPDVTGMKYEEAIKQLEAAGFEIGDLETQYDDTVEEGMVVSQNPKGGTKADKGAKITLVVSQGSEQVKVPDLKNMTEAEAKKALKDAGFLVGEVTEEYSDDVEAGKIASQDPAAGTDASKGSVVKLVISKGSEEVEVPNIQGLSLEAARKKCEDAGLSLSQSGSEYSDQYSADTIISQSPGKGTKVSKGSSVSCVVSKGKEDTSVSVPNVVGSSQSYAESALQNAGLKVSVVESFSSSVPKGNVINQSKTGTANKGDTITIEVSKGPEQPAAEE